ncbi:hypothetical protein [Rhizobium terrae]|uniref:hypothetical protein n=1 Tax=Rhizobium terrae TaxID=2171756 RepID=UPI000E3E6342|nr:hypothetical protein [Rhizobium terrae]
MKAAALLASSLFVMADAASAQDVECHSNKDFLVAAKSYQDEAGSQFAVTALAGKPKPAKCVFDMRKADFVIGTPGDPLWFGEQSGNLLILSRSTGPEGDLVIYDLKTRKAILDVPSDDYALENGRLTFWQRTAQATRKNCPSFARNKANGMGSVISVEKTFDFAANTVKDTGRSRCDATQ